MSLTIYYKSTRQIAAEETAVIRLAAQREFPGRSWLSCEPVSFIPELEDGTLVGGSKPNPAPDADDKRTARKSGLPDGTPRDLLDILARLSQEHAIDWELRLGSNIVGFVRSGRIDPQVVTKIEALPVCIYIAQCLLYLINAGSKSCYFRAKRVAGLCPKPSASLPSASSLDKTQGLASKMISLPIPIA